MYQAFLRGGGKWRGRGGEEAQARSIVLLFILLFSRKVASQSREIYGSCYIASKISVSEIWQGLIVGGGGI